MNNGPYGLAFRPRSNDNSGMHQVSAQVSAIESVGVYTRIDLIAPELAASLAAGRAVLAHSIHTYLRRTWWPCAIRSDGFSTLVDSGCVAPLRAGDAIDLIGPAGHGFRLEETTRSVLLVAAGTSAPDPDLGPLLPLADLAAIAGRSVTFAFADPAYPVSALPTQIEVIRVAPAGLIDLLPDAIQWADQIFACGPAAFVLALASRVSAIRFPTPRGFVQALTPRRLPCGVGVCRACGSEAGLTCVDGPVVEVIAGRGRAGVRSVT